MRGEKFDLLQRGTHVLVQVPRGADPEHTLLRVEANVTGGKSCDYAFITNLTITGKWSQTSKPHGIQYAAEAWGTHARPGPFLNFGPLTLKIAHGKMESGLTYLNFRIAKLGQLDLPVGGLLGSDDHTNASSKEDCLQNPDHTTMSDAGEVDTGTSSAV